MAVPTPSLHAKGPRGAFEPLCRGLRAAGGRRRREGCSSGVANASELPPSSQPSSQAPAGAIATLSPNGEGRGLQRETEARAPPMPGTGECSGERRAASGELRPPILRSVRRLWSLRQPASPAARPAVLAAGGPGCPRQDCPAHCRRQEPGAPHTFRDSCRAASRPSALPHRLHLPSCPKQLEATGRQPPPPLASASLFPSLSLASRETKGLFIKRIGGGGDGDGGGESIKTTRGWVRDEAERPPGAPSDRGGQEAPAGARSTPLPQSVITQVGARTRGRLGCPVEMLLAGSPKPGNRISPAAGPRLGGVRPAGSPLGDPGPLLFPANSFEIAQAWGEFASLFQRGSLSYTRLTRPHKVPELALVGYRQMARSPWGRRPGGNSFCCRTTTSHPSK